MTEIVIAAAARTPVGAFNGAFASLPGHALGTVAIKAAMEKLATESQKMGSALYQQPGAEGAANPGDAGPAGGQQAGGGADDVVDAEIVDEEKDKK